MRYRRRQTPSRDRGLVLVMVIAILVTITFAGTAFVVFMREASQAAANVAHLAQAELAARSGLDHAIRAIEEAVNLYVTPGGALDPVTGDFYTDPAADEDGEPGPDGAKVGWYRYFQGTDLISGEARCAHTTDGKVRGRRFDLSYPVSPVPRKRGEYVVYVEDLDGKLHANIAKWDGGLGNLADLLDLIQKAATSADSDITSAQTGLLGAASAGSPFSSMSEVARRGTVSEATKGKYALERHFTVYPVLSSNPGIGVTYELLSSSTIDATSSLIILPSADLTPDEAIGSLVYFEDSLEAFGVEANEADRLTVWGDCNESNGAEFVMVPRPAVNVNTAPEGLLAEVFLAISTMRTSGKPLCRALARYLCTLRALRPFANRHELEEAVRRATGDDALVDLGADEYDPDNDLTDPTFLTEHQFNDVLNSVAPVYRGMSQLEAKAQSAYDRPDKPGVYEFDGWPVFGGTGHGPSQTGGFHSSDENVTWSTELKFTSRFFHIYVVGRGWVKGAGDGSPAGVRRLHAIYDAKPDSNPPGSSPGRILWLRWNLSSRGSVSDITPPP